MIIEDLDGGLGGCYFYNNCPVCKKKYYYKEGAYVEVLKRSVRICNKCIAKEDTMRKLEEQLKEVLKKREEAEIPWIDKVIELAEQENIKISCVEKYPQGRVIRFSSPEDFKKEAGVYLWYKRVECWSEFGVEMSSIGYSGNYKEKIKEVMEEIVKETTGYKSDRDYDGFVKAIDTPEDAIKEVKLRIEKAIEIEELLFSTCENIKQNIKDAIEELSKDNAIEKPQEKVVYKYKNYHKTPGDIYEQLKEGKLKVIDLDKGDKNSEEVKK